MSRDLSIPWRDSPSPSTLSDIALLNKVREMGRVSISELSEHRISKSRIRLQCRYLRKCGLVKSTGFEIYEITTSGEHFLENESNLPHSNGYLHLYDLLDIPEGRITEFSQISQEDIKQINYDIFAEVEVPKIESEHEYSVEVRDPRRRPREVLSAKKWKLDRLIRELPRTEPIPAQCAHWITSIVSLHLFPDANHRTAMISLYRLALSNGVIEEDHRWPGSESEIAKAVLLSKFHRSLIPDLDFERIWRRNTLYWHWHQYFEYLLFDVDYPALRHHSEKELEEKLEKVRGTGP